MKEEDYSFYQEIEADYHKQDDYIARKKEKESEKRMRTKT